VLDDISGSVLEVSVTLGEIGGEELLDENTSILVEGLGKEDLASKNPLVDTHRILVAERRLAWGFWKGLLLIDVGMIRSNSTIVRPVNSFIGLRCPKI
jgi:hypothetical protein